MSINITVHGQPVNVYKERNLLDDWDYVKRVDREARRKVRLAQVRQQSKDLASYVRKRVRRQKERALNEIEKVKADELAIWQRKQIRQKQKEFEENCATIGAAHAAVAEEEQAIHEAAAKRARANAAAVRRGHEAARRLREMQKSKVKQVPVVTTTTEATTKMHSRVNKPPSAKTYNSSQFVPDDSADSLSSSIGLSEMNLLEQKPPNEPLATTQQNAISQIDSSDTSSSMSITRETVDVIQAHEMNLRGTYNSEEFQGDSVSEGGDKPPLFTQITNFFRHRQPTVEDHSLPLESRIFRREQKEIEKAAQQSVTVANKNELSGRRTEERPSSSVTKEKINNSTQRVVEKQNEKPPEEQVMQPKSILVRTKTRSKSYSTPSKKVHEVTKIQTTTPIKRAKQAQPSQTSQTVLLYDHINKFVRHYRSPPHLVVRTERNTNDLNAIEEARIEAAKADARLAALYELQEREDLRDQLAQKKVSVHREYEMISEQLEKLADEERIRKEKRKAASKKAQLNDKNSVNKSKKDPTDMIVDSQPMPEPTKARQALLQFVDTQKTAFMREIDSESECDASLLNVVRVEKLKDLLAKMNTERKALIEEIENNKTISTQKMNEIFLNVQNIVEQRNGIEQESALKETEKSGTTKKTNTVFPIEIESNAPPDRVEVIAPPNTEQQSYSAPVKIIINLTERRESRTPRRVSSIVDENYRHKRMTKPKASPRKITVTKTPRSVDDQIIPPEAPKTPDGSISTVYRSPPSQIRTAMGKAIEKRPANIEPKPQQMQSMPDYELRGYITRLLGMSRQSIDALDVNVSSVATPNSSVINVPANMPSPVVDDERMIRLRKFIDDNYSLVSEIENSYSTGKSVSPGSELPQSVASWKSVLRPPKSPSKRTKRTEPRKQTSAAIDQVERHSMRLGQRILNLSGEIDAEIIRKYSEVTNSCTTRIADLAAMIDQVREEKQRLIDANSTPDTDGLNSTEYLDLDRSKTPPPLAHSRPIDKSKDSGISVSRPVTASPVKEQSQLSEAIPPTDIPKRPTASRPPIAINRYSPQLEPPVRHELSTIVEVETPATSHIDTSVMNACRLLNASENSDSLRYNMFKGQEPSFGAENESHNVSEPKEKKHESTGTEYREFTTHREYVKERTSLLLDSANLEQSTQSEESLPDVVAELKRRNIIQHSFRNQVDSDQSEESSNVYISGVENIAHTSSDIGEMLGRDLEKMGISWAGPMLKKTNESRALISSGSSVQSSDDRRKLQPPPPQKSSLIDSRITLEVSNEASSSYDTSSEGRPLNLKDFLARELIRRSQMESSSSGNDDSSLASQFLRSLLADSSSISAAEKAAGSKRTSTPVRAASTSTSSEPSGEEVRFSAESQMSSVKHHSSKKSSPNTSEPLIVPSLKLNIDKFRPQSSSATSQPDDDLI